MNIELARRGRLIVRACLAVLLLTGSRAAWGASQDSAPPLPAPTGPVLTASNVSELQARVGQLTSGATLIIQPGTYRLTGTLYIGGGLSNVTIRGATNNRDDVVIIGKGMNVEGGVPYGIWTGNGVNGITIANLTIRDVYYHPIMLNAGTESPRIYNVRLVNAGQQFIKANPDGSGGGVDNGIVEYSILEYENAAKDAYTNGVDVHTGRNWIIRHNLFRRLRASGGLAGPAILMWNGSRDTIAEGNTFIDCQREIAFGLIERSPDDHTGGIIRNNFIYRSPGAGGDAAIGVFDSPGTKVLHNTIVMNGTYPNAIEYRFANTKSVTIAGNLGDRGVQARDGATASVQNNLWTATTAFFVNPSAGDLHLVSGATAAIDKVAASPDAPTDWDGQGRPAGAAADLGADEYSAGGSPGGGGGGGGGPVACEVSSWSAWQPVGSWSACSGGVQTRTERRTRTILVPPSNGGTACPTPLEETRTVSQACGAAPPPTEVCGDKIDNDGDGQIDEACGPTSAVPGAPTRLTRQVRGNRVTLSWLAPISGAPPSSYIVEAGLSPGTTAVALPTTNTRLTVPDVSPGRYYVRVRAMNAAGQSAASNEVVATVGAIGRPQRPQLTATANGSLVSLRWSDPDGYSGTSYRLQVGAQPGMSNIAEATVAEDNITAAAPPGTYYVRVFSVSDQGTSEPSNEVQVIVNGAACQPPAFATSLAAQVAGQVVTLAWGPVGANTAAAVAADQKSPVSYALEVGSAPGAADIATFPLGRTTMASTPAPHGTYYVRIRPVDACGAGPASNEVIVQVP